MGFVKPFQSLRSGDDSHKFNALASVLLDKVYRLHSRTAGSQHGIGYHDDSLVDRAWELAVVLVGLVSHLVAVEADMAYLGGGNESQNTITIPRPA